MNSTLIIDLRDLYRNYYRKFQKKIDYKKYLDFVKVNNRVVNTIAFGTQKDNSENFIYTLGGFGIEVKLAPIDHAIELVVCLTQLKTECIILGSADPQYLPVLRILRNEGKVLKCCASYVGRNMRQLFHEVHDLPETLSYETIDKPEQLELSADSSSDVFGPVN